MAEHDPVAAAPTAGPRALPATEVLMGRLGWLVRLRWLAVTGSLVFIEIGRRILPIHLALGPLFAVLAVLAAYNVVVWIILRSVHRSEGVDGRAPGSGAHGDAAS
ncbi:MAG TPA: hypothetical protein VJ957_06425, partial [Longimicrobiales bacterium]|nr:hypothetical protein [Longimicrobiales bacterium]